jgi:hypothetical protein
MSAVIAWLRFSRHITPVQVNTGLAILGQQIDHYDAVGG